MLIVGLTGGISSGKSTVSSRLRDQGLTIIDADLIAREVVVPGKRAYRQILETFGEIVPDLLNEDRTLNRAALGKAVFGNQERLKKLNSIVHPAVRREIFWQLLKAYFKLRNMVILDVPLLFESNLNQICGVTMTVFCDKDVQIKRLRSRNPELTEEDAEKRVNSQMSNQERNFLADYIVDNNGTMKELEKSIDLLLKQISPGKIMTLIDYFPPFGIVSAVYTYLLNLICHKFKCGRPPKLD